MNDKRIILNFLNKNYRVVTTQRDFAISDIDTEQTFNEPMFLELFAKVIGNFKTDENVLSAHIYHEWFESAKRRIAKKLTDYFDTLDGSLGSNELGEKVLKHFAYDGEFHRYFCTNYFNEYYTRKFMIPKLETYSKKFDKRKFSGDLTDEFLESLHIENMYQYEFAKSYLNNWYIDEVLEEKVKDLLSQFVVTLGRTNWNVTWVGHGPVTEETLKNIFKKENGVQFNYIKAMFEEWYDKAVIEKTEKLMQGIEANRKMSINDTLSKYLP